MPEQYREILNRLISFPLKSQIKIDFDLRKKIFVLSIPIYRSQSELPSCVESYVEARKEHRFKPHSTYFTFEGRNCVVLIQEIPFSAGFQPGLREEIVSFWKIAKHCHQLLIEMAVEEKYQAALHLGPDFEI